MKSRRLLLFFRFPDLLHVFRYRLLILCRSTTYLAEICSRLCSMRSRALTYAHMPVLLFMRTVKVKAILYLILEFAKSWGSLGPRDGRFVKNLKTCRQGR
jgi:hypothetical protein